MGTPVAASDCPPSTTWPRRPIPTPSPSARARRTAFSSQRTGPSWPSPTRTSSRPRSSRRSLSCGSSASRTKARGEVREDGREGQGSLREGGSQVEGGRRCAQEEGEEGEEGEEVQEEGVDGSLWEELCR